MNISITKTTCPKVKPDPSTLGFGKVFTDHLSALRRNLLKSKILKLAKGQYSCSYKTK